MKINTTKAKGKRSVREIGYGEVFQGLLNEEMFFMRVTDGAVCLNNGVSYLFEELPNLYEVVDATLEVKL